MLSLKQFFRSLIRHRLFMLVNVVGLSIGLACCLVIGLFVWHELSYDSSYAHANSIYLVGEIRERPGVTPSVDEFSAGPLAEAMQSVLSGVVAAARYSTPLGLVKLNSEKVSVDEARVYYADPSFFRIFDFHWLQGEPSAAFSTPDEIVLTRELALKYFGTEQAVGRVLTIKDNEVKVSGVVETPAATIVDFAALLPISFLERQQSSNKIKIGLGQVRTFMQLEEHTSLAAWQQQLPTFLQSKRGELKSSNIYPVTALNLQPLRKVYQSRSFQANENGLSNLARVKIFMLIGSCVLLIAIVNFMNLATARYSTRALEVGVNLTMGAGRTALVVRFLGEAILMTSIAMLLALSLAELALPVIRTYLDSPLSFAELPVAGFTAALVTFTLLVGVLAGVYPAFYLSAANPTRIMRGDLTKGRGGLWFRNLLVVVQFSVAIALIVTGVVMYRQLSYLRTLDLGFDAREVAVITLPAKPQFSLATQWQSLVQELSQVDGVVGLTHSMDSPLRQFAMGGDVSTLEGTHAQMGVVPGAADFLQFYHIGLLAGRYFLAESPAETTNLDMLSRATGRHGTFILNASAAHALGWTPSEAIGKIVQYPSQHVDAAIVIGVVDDTISSLNKSREPLVYTVPEVAEYLFFSNGALSMKIAAQTDGNFMERLGAAWKRYFPTAPMNVYLLDEKIHSQYRQEISQMGFIGYTALLAVLIACFGLFGLATFNAERRTKEIGIRKVVGSSVWQIVLLLTNDFSKLVLIANVVAWPVAYYAMSHWLHDFVYRIDLTPVVFIGSGLIALCIAWVTVGGTAAKAASRKPVLALRYE